MRNLSRRALASTKTTRLEPVGSLSVPFLEPTGLQPVGRLVQEPLFNSIEVERPDCLFVYITHDLDFAASRSGATTVWLKEYDGTNWKWELVPKHVDMPEEMLLSVLGSRKKVLLVEGDRSSLDFALYSEVYPDRTIIPMGGHSSVIEATKVLKNMAPVHHLEPMGIIDRDYRDDITVKNLEKKGVKVLDVHELEQILLTEPVIEAVAKSLAREDGTAIVDSIKALIYGKIKDNFEISSARLAANRMQVKLTHLNTEPRSEDALEAEFKRLTSTVDPSKMYAEAAKELKDALDRKDYKTLLRLYSDKGLVKEVAKEFEFQGSGYVEHIKRLAKKEDNSGLVLAIQNALPNLDPVSE